MRYTVGWNHGMRMSESWNMLESHARIFQYGHTFAVKKKQTTVSVRFKYIEKLL